MTAKFQTVRFTDEGNEELDAYETLLEAREAVFGLLPRFRDPARAHSDKWTEFLASPVVVDDDDVGPVEAYFDVGSEHSGYSIFEVKQ